MPSPKRFQGWTARRLRRAGASFAGMPPRRWIRRMINKSIFAFETLFHFSESFSQPGVWAIVVEGFNGKRNGIGIEAGDLRGAGR